MVDKSNGCYDNVMNTISVIKTLSISDINNQIIIYSNPVKDELSIQLNNKIRVNSIRVVDFTGRTIDNLNSSSFNLNI